MTKNRDRKELQTQGRFGRGNWFSRAAAPLVLVASALIAYGLFGKRHTRISADPVDQVANLWVAPAYLDLGSVWENDHFKWTVPVENREAFQVDVTSFSRSCSCLSVHPEAFSLQPGGKQELHLEIDLSSRPTITDDISIRLWPLIKEHKQGDLVAAVAPHWNLVARLQKALDFDRRVDLGRYSELAQPLPDRSVPIRILAPVREIGADSDAPWLTASITNLDQSSADLRLKLASPLAVGPFRCNVTIKVILKDGQLLPEHHLTVSGTIAEDVEAVPPVAQVGGRLLGQTFEETLFLRSLTGRGLTLRSFDVEGEGLSVHRIDEEPRVSIRQTVCRKGSQTNVIRIYAESGGQSHCVVVPVNYTGLEEFKTSP